MSQPTVFKYDLGKLPFVDMATAAVARAVASQHPGKRLTDLSKLHEVATEQDITAVFSALYGLFMTPEFQRSYDALCSDIIRHRLKSAASYQRVPSARVQMPGMRSVNFHTDQWYGHGENIINFWLPLVSVGNTGPAVQEPGELMCGPGVKSAVWPLPPIANTRPSGNRIDGPISNTPTPRSVSIASDTGTSCTCSHSSSKGT